MSRKTEQVSFTRDETLSLLRKNKKMGSRRNYLERERPN